MSGSLNNTDFNKCELAKFEQVLFFVLFFCVSFSGQKVQLLTFNKCEDMNPLTDYSQV